MNHACQKIFNENLIQQKNRPFGRFFFLYHLDLDLDPGGQVQVRKGFHDARIGIQDLNQPLMDPELELLAGILIDER